MNQDENNSFQTGFKDPAESARLVEPVVEGHEMPSRTEPEFLNAGTAGDAAKITTRGIRSRWENSQDAPIVRPDSKKQQPVDDGGKAAKKRLKVIILMSVCAVIMSFLAAAKDPALYAFVNLAPALGANQLGLAIYEANYKNDPKYAFLLINMANATADRDPQGALSIYDKAVKYAPLNSSCYMNRGLDFLTLSKAREALADFDKAIALNPTYSLALRNRGNYYSDRGEYTRAIHDYNKAIETNGKFNNPSRNFFYFDRALCYFRMKEYQKAIEDFDRSRLAGWENAYLYNYEATCYQQIGKFQLAIDNYIKALSSDADNEEAKKGIKICKGKLAGK